MPAGLPGDSVANNTGSNPKLGRAIIMDPLSGPKGSPLDKDSANNASTGALSTGIGIGPNYVIGGTAPASVVAAGFNDNDIPGEVPTYAAPPPPGVVASSAINSTRMYIGGGRTVAESVTPDKYSKPFKPSPYTAGVALAAAGGGNATRDNGAGPAFTGAPMKVVTATGAVANGAAVETGILNATVALVSGQSVFGVAAALAAPSDVDVMGAGQLEKGKRAKPVELQPPDGGEAEQQKIEKEFDKNLQLELEQKEPPHKGRKSDA